MIVFKPTPVPGIAVRVAQRGAKRGQSGASPRNRVLDELTSPRAGRSLVAER